VTTTTDAGGKTNAFTMIDRALSFRWAKGFMRHTRATNLQAVQEFQGAREEDKIKYMYSDSALELLYVSRNMGIGGFHDTNIPGDSQGDGVAENNNRDIMSALLRFFRMQGCRLHIGPMPFNAIVSDAMQLLWTGSHRTEKDF
jgi:hypothetical protein